MSGVVTRWFCLSLLLVSVTGAAAPAPEVSSEEARDLPDQVQVRILGRVTAIGTGGRSLRVEADGMTFVAEVHGASASLPRRGDRVMVTGTLKPEGRVLVRTLERVSTGASAEPLTGTVLSVSTRRHRLILRGERGERYVVGFGPETTFVRLGRRSAPQKLNFGDRVWVDREQRNGSATRVEVMAANGHPVTEVGEITAVDRDGEQLRVRFGPGARTVIAGRAAIRAEGREVPLTTLRVGENIRVSGVDRNGVIVARAIERLSRSRAPASLVGRIESLDLERRLLRVASRSLLPITSRVHLPEGARIMVGRRPLVLGDLRVGDRVRVTGSTGAEGVLEASRIDRLRQGSTAGTRRRARSGGR
jgi:hypothetical protein